MKHENLSENSKNTIVKIYLFRLTHKSSDRFYMDDDSELYEYLFSHNLILSIDRQWKNAVTLNIKNFNNHVENIFLTTEKLLELI